jgi:hypothetical protein
LSPYIRLKKKEDGFVRTTPSGKQIIVFPLYDYNPVFQFALAVSIRLNAVEDVVNLFSGTAPERQLLTYTTITRLDYFTREHPTGFRVTTEADIEKACDILAGILRDRVFPFLDEYQDLNAVDRAVNLEQRPGFDIAVWPWPRHLTIAYLARNPNFESLISAFRAQAAQAPQMERDKYEKLVQYLETRL